MESISSAGVVELRIHVSVSAMMSCLWLSVRSLSAVTCSGVSIERVLRVHMRRFAGWVGPGLSWISHREAMWRRVKKDELVSAVNVQWKLSMQEGVCLDGCIFVLM